MNTDHEEDEKEAFKPPPKMADLPAMTPMSNDPNTHRSIPTVDQMNLMPSYGQPSMPMPTPSPHDPNSNNDVAAAAKVPNLQSNMFKMQRNKSNFTQFHLKNCNLILASTILADSFEKVVRRCV